MPCVGRVNSVGVSGSFWGFVTVSAPRSAGDGAPETEGDYAIDGVPGTAARIALEFLAPGGSLGGGVLPTGAPREGLTLADGRRVEVSLVDVGALGFDAAMIEARRHLLT